MTQEEKARAYDEALDRCKEWVSGTWRHSVDDTPKDVAEFIFPQLAESEDERIRKAIIHYILYETKGAISEATEHTWVKWLEKQKERKPVERSDDIEQAAARYERENRRCLLSSVDIVNAFIEGAKWMANQMPMPEDTVIFQKGVAEGRRLEREDRNDDKLYGD